MLTTKKFDVSIKVFFPYTTKSISTQDHNRIAVSTDLSYKAQPNKEVVSNVVFEEIPEIKTPTDRVLESKSRLLDLIKEFESLRDKA